MRRSPRQILLRIQDDEFGKAMIRRGVDGEGYSFEGEDFTFPLKFCFPVDANFVAEEFSKAGLQWRFE